MGKTRLTDATGRPRAPRQLTAGTREVPILLTPDEVAEILRTTRAAVYTMNHRGLLPGATSIGTRILFHADDLLQWLDQKRASSPQE
jgi:excisionase family DNA binding protein